MVLYPLRKLENHLFYDLGFYSCRMKNTPAQHPPCYAMLCYAMLFCTKKGGWMCISSLFTMDVIVFVVDGVYFSTSFYFQKREKEGERKRKLLGQIRTHSPPRERGS